jgi:RimJ/RimL family protein N-acetyltransferase
VARPAPHVLVTRGARRRRPDANRVQASTDVDNGAEQEALRRAGFAFEGVLRGAQWRCGAYHDLQSWARLHTDA